MGEKQLSFLPFSVFLRILEASLAFSLCFHYDLSIECQLIQRYGDAHGNKKAAMETDTGCESTDTTSPSHTKQITRQQGCIQYKNRIVLSRIHLLYVTLSERMKYKFTEYKYSQDRD